ncbi:hypothetical protein LXA43DRAFT_1068576 [Ganoderma leucocontextum]|nr:hypothetical protein LXA43DRAFT_1068576 [Ganoderma leucocontextum]
MPELLVALSEAQSILICPLKSSNQHICSPSLCFVVINYNGSEKHPICCICRDVSPHLFLPKTPLIFNILGKIAMEHCFLTTQGHLWPTDEEPVASCWLQGHLNSISKITRCSIILIIEAVVDEFGDMVDTSHLLSIGADRKLQLQIIWQREVGELPVFDRFGVQQVPTSIS